MENSRAPYPLRFGVIPSGRPRAVNLRADDFDKHPDVDWASVIIPSDYQKEGSCVARATCNLIECLLRMRSGAGVFAKGEQLDAAKLYWAARDHFYGDKTDEGLQLDQALVVAIQVFGMLPPDTEIVEIEPILPAIVAALHNSPLIQAHLVGKHWLRENVNRTNGWIHYEDVNPLNAIGGHATLMTGYRNRDGDHRLHLQNSWENWGWHGQGVMSFDTWWGGFKWVMDGPYTVKLGENWATWDGWKKYVVKGSA